MSTFQVNYYSPNDTNYIATIDTAIIDNTVNPNLSCLSDSSQCLNVTPAITKNTNLANNIQIANNKNTTSLGLYNDSSLFYTTQYIQLWNMAGGIALSSYLIYYLVYVKK
jgi:hypothetical protein